MRLQQVVAVTLLVQDMSDFPTVNKAYVSHFGKNPPVRVCVECPVSTKVLLSAVGKQQSTISTMHVQSISHWAPANIGPYSQATWVDGVLHIAGQIGLIPGSMELPQDVGIQAKLAMQHLIRVINVYKLNATNIVQVSRVYYVLPGQLVSINFWLIKNPHIF